MSSPGHEMGKLDFSGLRIEMLGADAAFARGSWQLTMSDGEDSARAIHAGVPQVSRGMEDCARPHFGSGIVCFPLSLLFYLFARTWTRVPSGSLPFVNSTTPLRMMPSSSCRRWHCLRDAQASRRCPQGSDDHTWPMPLSIASFARRSASVFCSRRAWPMENHSSWAINSFARP